MTEALFEYLKTHLRDRGWTIPQFARACGVNVQLAYKWFTEDASARTTPGPKSCEKIALAFGVDPDLVLELAGHRGARESHSEIDVRRQVVRDQLDRWLAAVGPENEEYFWQHLKAQGDATVDLLKRVGTAVNPQAEGAVNAAVSRRSRRAGHHGSDLGGPLMPS